MDIYLLDIYVLDIYMLDIYAWISICEISMHRNLSVRYLCIDICLLDIYA